MFADNRKISLRQVRRLLILDIFGMSSLMLPGILASMTGADGLICLILGMAGGLVLLWLMGKNLQYVKENYYSYMKDTAGELVGDIFMVFYFLYFITLCGFVLYQTSLLVLVWLRGADQGEGGGAESESAAAGPCGLWNRSRH